METIIFLLLIIIIWVILKLNKKIKFWTEKIIQRPLNYYLLIGLLIIGFLLNLDNSNRFGCIIGVEPIFELKNILFSTISITFVLLSFFAKKKTIKLMFISLELLFWILKLFLFKGGYAVGIIGTADIYISIYDFTTLILRLFIINSLLNMNINQVYVLICTIIIMFIKIYIYPLPYSFYVEKREFHEESENTKNYLTNGEWIENKNIIRKIKIIFNTNSAILYNLQNNDSLFFNQIYWSKEVVFLESLENSNLEFCNFEFQENGKDTLNVNFTYKDENYKTQMIRKQQ